MTDERKAEIDRLCRKLNIPTPESESAYRTLNQALTTTDAAKTRLKSNQRLEYLGDAVLSTVVREYLLSRYSNLNEGPVSHLEHLLTCNITLREMAERIGLGEFLAHGAKKPEKIPSSVLADGMEALLGALYLNDGGGMQSAHKVLRPLLRDLIRELPEGLLNGHYSLSKTALSLWPRKPAQTKGQSA